MRRDSNEVSSGHAFSAAAARPEAPRRKKRTTHTVSLRLSAAEWAQLKRDAGALSQSAFIRTQLFGDDASPRRREVRSPVKDHAALGRVLDALGRSGLADDFGALNWSIDEGVVHVDADIEHAIRRTCSDIAAMRADLMKALGLRVDQLR